MVTELAIVMIIVHQYQILRKAILTVMVSEIYAIAVMDYVVQAKIAVLVLVIVI
jgi:hypothetical protein